MCGIAGFINARGCADGAVLQAMLRRIAHRGPDGQGMFLDGAAALGHRRLAVIDLEGGPQPMFNEDGRLALVFNGEIYNYRDLTRELTAAGHAFATRSDSEVLLHGWEQWGRGLLPRLRGMFAFALWDRQDGALFCARDAFGVKPLYYCQTAEGTLLFASEIKAFLDHPAFEKRLNTAQLELYLSCQYSPGADTFFCGVKKLLPGHWLEWRGGRLRTGRWWAPDLAPARSPGRWDGAIDAVLRDSVAAHKVADVEVAGFLSGGVDSACLTALGRPARCYTIGYAEPGYDETAEAAALARHLGVEHRVRRITPEEFWAALPAVQYHMDEPLADAAAVALYFLNQEAAREYKVCLSGEGADELFAGYNIYCEPFTARWYDRLPAAFPPPPRPTPGTPKRPCGPPRPGTCPTPAPAAPNGGSRCRCGTGFASPSGPPVCRRRSTVRPPPAFSTCAVWTGCWRATCTAARTTGGRSSASIAFLSGTTSSLGVIRYEVV